MKFEGALICSSAIEKLQWQVAAMHAPNKSPRTLRRAGKVQSQAASEEIIELVDSGNPSHCLSVAMLVSAEARLIALLILRT
jgi:hypothetical protein